MYKLSHHMLPSMFENMFIYTSDVHDYYARQADLLYIQYAPTRRSQRTIKYYGTILCNIISGIIQPDCAISTFKQKLKIFLLFIFFFNFKLCVFSFYFIIFFLSTFSWLLTKWYSPALCTCSCSRCFNEFAVLMNLGHIIHYFCPLCQGCHWRYYALQFDDFLWCIMYLHCWLLGFDFYTTLTINIRSLFRAFVSGWFYTINKAKLLRISWICSYNASGVVIMKCIY